jgi:hypothetical protein
LGFWVWELLLLLGLGAALTAGIVLLDSDDEDVSEEFEDQISGVPVGDDFRLVDGTQIVGTQGDDVLTGADLN